MYDMNSRRRASRERLEREMNARMNSARMRTSMDRGFKMAGVVIIVIIAVVAIIWSINAHQDWKRSCERRGGHVASHTNWGGSNNSNTDTTYYCLNDNGGIIDIR